MWEAGKRSQSSQPVKVLATVWPRWRSRSLAPHAKRVESQGPAPSSSWHHGTRNHRATCLGRQGLLRVARRGRGLRSDRPPTPFGAGGPGGHNMRLPPAVFTPNLIAAGSNGSAATSAPVGCAHELELHYEVSPTKYCPQPEALHGSGRTGGP